MFSENMRCKWQAAALLASESALQPEQREPVLQKDGPMIIIVGAGSGDHVELPI
jgi:hypothetical protein